MSKKLLPLGSIVYLEEGTVPLAIIVVSSFVQKEETGEKLYYFDYAGTPYPQGLIDEEELYYFHHENISEVVFEGYKNEQHERYLKSVEEWKEKNADAFEIAIIEQFR